MRKLIGLSISAIAIMVLTIGGHSAKAEAATSTVGFISRPSEAADLKGDNNGIGRFNRNENNKLLFRIHGTITSLSDTSITIMSKKMLGDSLKATADTSYTFSIDETTKVLRRFRAASSVAEMTVGDQVRIWATKLTGGNAQLIWDKSIWWIRVTGTISNLDTVNQTFDLLITRTAADGTVRTFSVSVKTTDATVYVTANGAPALFTDLANGSEAQVRGVWNHIGCYLTARNIHMQ